MNSSYSPRDCCLCLVIVTLSFPQAFFYFYFFRQTLGLYFSCVVSRQFNEFVLACAALYTREAYTKGVAEEWFFFLCFVILNFSPSSFIFLLECIIILNVDICTGS